jgi:acetyl-CoA/propionyl-CoA carboxylase biotin carboxyl carrier protein
MFEKVLIANRGEIAVRVARTCREMGIATVAVFSDPDEGAQHVAAADEAVHLPGTAATDTYLRVAAVIDAARATGAQAVHPGYGFLSERGEAARAVIDAGLAWVGPAPDAVDAVGDKLRARRLAEGAGVPVVPGTLEPVRTAEDIHAFGRDHGYPVAIKAAGGGGGRGFRVAADADGAAAALEGAAREATTYFGSGDVYLERYLAGPKHIEVQILAERPGQAFWLGARECSLQRRHQKLVEETPPSRFEELVPVLGDAAAKVADACGYTNAGTVEFLVDDDGSWFFLEVNARLQVEHTITEEVTGLDLVACQLMIAAGEPLGFGQADLLEGGRFAPRGHSIECRINAEDPSRNFLPSPGTIDRYVEPGGPGVRLDGGFVAGDTISPAYDSLIAKLVVRGADREQARRRMLRALDEYRIDGLRTTIPAHRVLLRSPAFVDGSYTTRTVEQGALDELAASASPASPRGPARRDVGTEAPVPVPVPVPATDGRTGVGLWHPAIAPSIRGARSDGQRAAPADAIVSDAASEGSFGRVLAPMHGTILSISVSSGDAVEAGQPVAVLEAMKMETAIAAPAGGTIEEVRVQAGQVVEPGQVLALIR